MFLVLTPCGLVVRNFLGGNSYQCLLPWKWRQQTPLKHWYLFTKLLMLNHVLTVTVLFALNILKIYLIESLSRRFPKRNFQRKKSYAWQQNRLSRSGLNWKGSGELQQFLQNYFSSVSYKHIYVTYIFILNKFSGTYSIMIFCFQDELWQGDVN